jgi:hypothetical protein
MENGNQQINYSHTKPDGSPIGPDTRYLTKEQVRVVECWQTRIDQTIGNQVIKAGTWMMTARVLDDTLWESIKKGEVKSWSVGSLITIGDIEIVEED